MSRALKLAKSKAVWGAILGAGAWLIAQPAIGITEIIQAVGTVIAAVGLRDAALKSAPPDSIDGQKINPEL